MSQWSMASSAHGSEEDGSHSAMPAMQGRRPASGRTDSLRSATAKPQTDAQLSRSGSGRSSTRSGRPAGQTTQTAGVSVLGLLDSPKPASPAPRQGWAVGGCSEDGASGSEAESQPPASRGPGSALRRGDCGQESASVRSEVAAAAKPPGATGPDRGRPGSAASSKASTQHYGTGVGERLRLSHLDSSNGGGSGSGSGAALPSKLALGAAAGQADLLQTLGLSSPRGGGTAGGTAGGAAPPVGRVDSGGSGLSGSPGTPRQEEPLARSGSVRSSRNGSARVAEPPLQATAGALLAAASLGGEAAPGAAARYAGSAASSHRSTALQRSEHKPSPGGFQAAGSGDSHDLSRSSSVRSSASGSSEPMLRRTVGMATRRTGGVSGSGDSTAVPRHVPLRVPQPTSADTDLVASTFSLRKVLLQEASLHGHQSSVRALAVGPLSDKATGTDCFASASWGSTIRLWRAEGEQYKRTAKLRGHVGPVYCLAFSADGGMLFSGGEDATLRVWDAASAELRATLPGHSSRVWSVAVVAGWDGLPLLLSGAEDGEVRVWSVNGDGTGSGTGRVGGQEAEGGDLQARLKWEWVRVLRGHRRGVNCVAAVSCVEAAPAVAARGVGYQRLAASASDDGTIRVWSLDTYCCLQVLEAPPPRSGWGSAASLGAVYGLAWAVDCPAAPSKTKSGGAAAARATSAGTQRRTGKQGASASSPINPGLKLLSVSEEGMLRAWAMVSEWDNEWECVAAAPRADGRRRQASRFCGGLAVSPDGSVAVTGADDGSLAVWDLRGGGVRCRGEQAAHKGAVRAVAWGADGRRVLTGGQDAAAVVWQLCK